MGVDLDDLCQQASDALIADDREAWIDDGQASGSIEQIGRCKALAVGF
ncbi:MAG: hypothetical protein WCA48_22185 [Pseudomonas gingeri]